MHIAIGGIVQEFSFGSSLNTPSSLTNWFSFGWAWLQLLKGDSTLRTLHSDTKINILNPNLNVKMFNKGVQTNIENTFSVPFPPNKKML